MATNSLYRSRKGELFGICQGIADWKDLPVGVVRLIAAIAIITTGIWPGLLVYAVVALILPLQPEGMGYTERPGRESAHGHDYQSRDRYQSRPRSREEMREHVERLKRKVEEMEDEIFNKERDWDRRFNGSSH